MSSKRKRTAPESKPLATRTHIQKILECVQLGFMDRVELSDDQYLAFKRWLGAQKTPVVQPPDRSWLHVFRIVSEKMVVFHSRNCLGHKHECHPDSFELCGNRVTSFANITRSWRKWGIHSVDLASLRAGRDVMQGDKWYYTVIEIFDEEHMKIMYRSRQDRASPPATGTVVPQLPAPVPVATLSEKPRELVEKDAWKCILSKGLRIVNPGAADNGDMNAFAPRNFST